MIVVDIVGESIVDFTEEALISVKCSLIDYGTF